MARPTSTGGPAVGDDAKRVLYSSGRALSVLATALMVQFTLAMRSRPGRGRLLRAGSWLLLAGSLLAAGCAGGPASSPDSASAFDPQLLIGPWRGQWQTDLERGPAYLDIRDIQDQTVFGRLYLENYAGHVGATGGQDSPVTGILAARGGRLRLALTGSLMPVELTIAGTVMRGTMSSGASPSTAVSLFLQQVSGYGPPPPSK